MKKFRYLLICLALVISLGLGMTATLDDRAKVLYPTGGPGLPLPLPPVEDDPPNANGTPQDGLLADGPGLPLPLPPVEDDPPNANGAPADGMPA